jgi:DNA invertase Pin-like site-specific DNA recombinase
MTASRKPFALVYARKSMQGEKEVSIERQLALCVEAAEERGWIPRVFEEPEGHRSGMSDKSRPGWARLIAEAETHPDLYAALIVADIARAHRKLVNFLDLVNRLGRWGIELISIREHFDTTTAAGRALMTVVGAMNEWFAADIGERMRTHIQYVRDAGGWVGRPPPGLIAVGKGAQRHLEPRPETYSVNGRTHTYLDTVIAIYELYTGPQPIGSLTIAEKATAAGYRFRGPGGKPVPLGTWHVGRVIDSVDAYAQTVDPALLSKVRHRRAERNHWKQNGPRMVHPPLPLWGILYCGYCGKRIVQSYINGYPNYRHVVTGCPYSGNVAAHFIDPLIQPTLRLVQKLTPEEITEWAKRAAEAPPDPTLDERKRLDDNLMRLENSWVEGIILKETYLAKRREILDALAKLPPPPTRAPLTPEATAAFLHETQKLLTAIDTSDPYMQNRLRRDIFKKVYVKGRILVGLEANPPFDQLIAYYRQHTSG